ncbi:PAS domain S-box protein [Saccharophagus sp. K07]|jgi:PAS domain S-box-containing protein|uniref:PAS domain-containing protein n=1 Tax=Saccharophagus sp. K07 TaxID=2283636 RepID=UPI0016525AB3|nr:PAS domain-containing protein [Saccharophagus sp. K07]MBC6903997.1 PAS domain S-box protein [Saccharophagus sp. K07]
MQRFSLRQKLILGLLVLGGLLTIAIAIIEVYIDYRGGRKEIDEQIKIIESASLPILRSALWALDDAQVRRLLEGMLTVPMLGYVEVESDGRILSAGRNLSDKEKADTIHREFPVFFDDGERIHNLGELRIYAPLEPLYQKLSHQTFLTLAVNAVRTLVVAFLAGWLFDHLVTRHVRRVAKYLEQTPYAADAPKLSLTRTSSRRDELDELVAAVNHLRTKLNLYDREIRDEKSRYYALVENNPEAIWRCEMREPISVHSPSAQQVEQLKEVAVLAEINEASANLTPGKSRHQIIGASWNKLPFLDDSLWHELVQRHYRVKDWISRFVDENGTEHFFSNSLTCLITDGQIKTVWGIAIEITQRVVAQRELENREQQLSLSQTRLAEAQALAHMGHWTYKIDDDVLQVSDEFARIYGFDPYNDRPTWEQLVARIHPDDRARIFRTLNDPTATAVGAEHRIVWPNGEERHVQAIARKEVVDQRVTSTFGIIMDITDRRRAEEERRRSQQALIESEARMAEAQAIAHLGHWILDQNTQTLSCSDEFFRLFGHPPQSFQPTVDDFYRQIHPEDQERIRQMFDNLAERALSYEYRIIRTDGAVRYMRGTITPFYSGGKDVRRVFGISMDVTEHKIAEQIAEQQQKQLLRADKLASLGIMVAGVAHEINNPNHLIQMNADLLDGFTHHLLSLLEERIQDERDQLDFNGMSIDEIMSAMPELLADIKASCRRIDRIVKDLKDFSRPRDNAEFLPLDLNQVIEKTQSLLSSTLDKRKIRLEYDLAAELPQISGDSQQLEQILINLVSNALDAVDETNGRVLVRTYSSNIDTGDGKDEAKVICDVIDNGCGITDENIRHIFDPFFTTKQERGGTGLGLSISFRLIREHGGQLEVISEPEQGTTMRIILPTRKNTA